MTSGLLASLSPPQEIALRRIAHGSFVVDAQAAASLIALALVQRTNNGLRLTPLGRLRYNALPKAPLLGHQRSIQAATGYVEGLIEKAQSRVSDREMLAKTSPLPPPARTPAPRTPAPAGLLLEAQDGGDDPGELPVHQPIYFFFDCEQWKSRAQHNLTRTRQAIMEHRQRQITLCDASRHCIESSRSLLRTSVPVRPSWFNAAS